MPEPPAAPKAVGTTTSVSDSEEDSWGQWRPAKAGPATPDAARVASIPEPTTPPASWQQPPMEPIAANATIARHTRGPTPRHGRSELKATPPWRESLASRGFRGPYLQVHLEAQGLGPLRDSYLRMRAKESAQLPLSLEESGADLRSTVRRVAALGPPPGASAATTAKDHHPLSLRMELEHGLMTGAAFEERRRARSRDIHNAQAERERATAKARLILPPPPPVPRLPMEEETPITPAPGDVTMAAPMAPPTTTAPSMASSPAKATTTAVPAKAASLLSRWLDAAAITVASKRVDRQPPKGERSFRQCFA